MQSLRIQDTILGGQASRPAPQRAGRARVYAVRDRQDYAEEKGRGARASDDEKPSAKRGDDWVEMDKYTPDDDRGDAK